PIEAPRQVRRENAEDLPVEIIERGGRKKQRADAPAIASHTDRSGPCGTGRRFGVHRTAPAGEAGDPARLPRRAGRLLELAPDAEKDLEAGFVERVGSVIVLERLPLLLARDVDDVQQIGRAACRER